MGEHGCAGASLWLMPVHRCSLAIGPRQTHVPQNPFGNLNVDDIPVEIVDGLNDISQDVTVTSVIKGHLLYFHH